MSNFIRCESRSEDGRQCHGAAGHYPETTHWAAASRVWTDTETLVRPPPTTLERVRALADQWNDTPDYASSEYDQGRVDQRHVMTEQLLEALGVDAEATA